MAKKILQAKKIIAAATVAHKETLEILEKEVEHVEVILRPSSSSFNYVAQCYQDFPQVTDDQVIQVMKIRGLLS